MLSFIELICCFYLFLLLNNSRNVHGHDQELEECSDLSPDCRLIAVKCLSPNRIEQKLMELACPMVCGYCPEVQTIRTTTTTIKPKCFDEFDDCKERRHFCHRRLFNRMMTIQCAKTCKFCDSIDNNIETNYERGEEETYVDTREVNLEKLRNKMGSKAVDEMEKLNIVDNVIDLMKSSTSTLPPSTFITTDTKCFDRANDCQRNIKLCNHRAYHKLFRKLCAKTCDLCHISNDDQSSDGVETTNFPV